MIDISETYIITTPSAVDRRQKLVENMKLANFHQVLPIPQSWFIGSTETPVPFTWKYSDGAWYCRESHRQILQKFVDKNMDTHICIMEDDCVFADAFSKSVTAILSSIDRGFDVLMLGGQHLRGTPANRDIRLPFCRVNHPVNRLHCYIVSLSGAKQCLREIEMDCVGFMIDDIIGQAYPNINIYCACPFVVGQAAGVSATCGNCVGERFWN